MNFLIKKNVFLFVFIIFFNACSGSHSEADQDKKVLLDKIKQQILDLKTQASELEKAIKLESLNDSSQQFLKKVYVEQISYTDFSHYIEVQGSVTADKNIVINPETSGAIVRNYVSEGNKVRKGQKLFQLDTEILRKNIDEVKTSLEFATTVFNKQERLWKQKVSTEIQYLEAKNQKERLERNLKSLESQLAKATVRSPISGIVDEIFMNQGEIAHPSLALLRIVNLDLVEITAEISETYIDKVHKNDLVTVVLPHLNYQEQLPIKHIGQFINPNNRSFKIFLKCKNKNSLLKPNMVAALKIKDFNQEKGLVVPSNVILQATDGKQFIYIVEKDQKDDYIVHKKHISPISTYNNQTLIGEGLKENDIIITKGYDLVVDKQEVGIIGL